MQPHLETMKHNTDALILYEIQNKEQKDQISSLKNKINNLEKKWLEEQE